MPWKFDSLAKKMPFYAQLWYDTHGKDENYIYSMTNESKASLGGGNT